MRRRKYRLIKSIFSRFLTWEYFLCLFLSFLFWLLIKLSDNYQSTLTLQAEYLNQPTYKILRNEPVKEFTISMETTGWNLLTGSLKSEDRVVQIDLSPYSGDHITINTESLLDRVSESLSQDYRLISVYPSAVNLDYEALIYKTVPVKADVQMIYAEGFGFPEAFTLSPDSITISGIASDLESIDYWPTQSRTFNQLKKNIDTELDLKRPEQFNIKLNFEKVRFEQEVSPVQSMELNVPIEVIGVPEGLTVTILPSEALLLFSTYESKKDELKPEDFFVVADFADSSAIGNGSVELSVKDTTDLVWDIILETPEVSFIFYEE